MKMIRLRCMGAIGALIFGSISIAAPASAVPIVTTVGVDLAPLAYYTVPFLDSGFIVTGTGGFPDYLAVATEGGAAVRTVFGRPSTDFSNRGTVIYDQFTLGGYASFAALTAIPLTNGDNFLGLRVTVGSLDYYGFLYTTDTVLNSYGFETAPGTAITATTALAPPTSAAVPEPASWAMMIGGFGMVGVGLRRRRKASVRFA